MFAKGPLQMKSKINSILLSLTLLGAAGGMLHSAVTSEEAEKLGNELTPMGGEMAGSEGRNPDYVNIVFHRLAGNFCRC